MTKSKFQELYRKKTEQPSLREEEKKKDLLVVLGQLFGGSVFIFTFLSGVIFTLIPLLRNVIAHAQTHIIDPIQRWMAAEPTTGNSLMFLLYATFTVVILYSIRNKLQIIGLWMLAKFERWDEEAKFKQEVKKTQKLLKKPFGDIELTPNSKISLTPTKLDAAEDDKPLF